MHDTDHHSTGPIRGTRARSGRSTVRDVAERAGVSTQTVSRVINARPDVAEATRAVVQAAIHDLDYQPSAAARSLASQRSSTIGVAVAGLSYVGTARSLSGIIASSTARGYMVVVNEFADVESTNFDDVLTPLLGRQVDGLIFCGPEVGDNVATIEARYGEHGVPLVFAHSTPADRRLCIAIDNASGVTQAIDHLVAQGCRRIGHISGPLRWAEAAQRRDGWLAGLAHHGLGDAASLLYESDWSPKGGAVGLDRLLELDSGLDAVIAANDQTALGVLHRAQQLGISVPDRLCVVGFDDITEAEMFTPPLSTIRQPLVEAGRAAVDLLLGLIDGTAPTRQHLLRTELVVRESSTRRAAI